MKTCTKCGGTFDDKYNFCPQCGEKYAPERPKKKPLVSDETTYGVSVEKLYEKEKYAAYEVHLTREIEMAGFTVAINTPIGTFTQKADMKNGKGTCHKTVSCQTFIPKETNVSENPTVKYVIFFYYIVDDWKDTLLNKADKLGFTPNEEYFDKYAESFFASKDKNTALYGDIFASFFGDAPKVAGNCPDCNGTGYKEQVSKSLFGKMITKVKCKSCNGTGNI